MNKILSATALAAAIGLSACGADSTEAEQPVTTTTQPMSVLFPGLTWDECVDHLANGLGMGDALFNSIDMGRACVDGWDSLDRITREPYRDVLAADCEHVQTMDAEFKASFMPHFVEQFDQLTTYCKEQGL